MGRVMIVREQARSTKLLRPGVYQVAIVDRCFDNAGYDKVLETAVVTSHKQVRDWHDARPLKEGVQRCSL